MLNILMINYRDSEWCYLSSEEIHLFFLPLVRVGADHIDPNRDWDGSKINLKLYKYWSICSYDFPRT